MITAPAPVVRSQLDELIEPEIRADRFFHWIVRIAATPGVRTILEIGSSTGAGSTEAFVAGALRNPDHPDIHCLEVSKPRFAALSARFRHHEFVHCYNMSSVPEDLLATPAQVDAFRRRVWTRFRFIRRATVLRWLEQDRTYLREHGLSGHGIRSIRQTAGVDRFDVVLIDGSEFTGPAELAEVYGARFLLLDDIRSFKNYDNWRRLRSDPAYRLLVQSYWLRNGFAIFERGSAR